MIAATEVIFKPNQASERANDPLLNDVVIALFRTGRWPFKASG
jgi:hypothetical protein